MASKSGEDYIPAARKWSEDNNYKLDSIEESGKKLTFKLNSVSFYVYTPESDSEGWNVWSVNDACVSALSISEVQEFFRMPNRSIREVLSKAAQALSKLQYQMQVSTASSTSQSGEDVDEDDEDDGYYQDDDYDVDDDDMGFGNETVEVKPKETQTESADDFFTGGGSPAAVHRLLSDLKGMQKTAGKYGVQGRPINDNLFLWEVELSEFEPGTRLRRDLEHYATTYKRKPVIQLEMKFPKDYPMNPPFVRVIRPRFKFLTGHITIGGSICMQMLTRSGWSPSNDIESILIQVRAEIMSDGNAQLDVTPDREYSEFEAKDAFERMVMSEGGYSYQFVDQNLKSMFFCRICDSVSRDPHDTQCCHKTFCKSCIDQSRYVGISVCPNCRKEPFYTTPFVQLHREIQVLFVYCENKIDGCEWIGELETLNKHLETCCNTNTINPSKDKINTSRRKGNDNPYILMQIRNHVKSMPINNETWIIRLLTSEETDNAVFPVIKMPNFNDKMATNLVWNSIPFYTLDKYKMKLQVIADGRGDGKGTHLSVALLLVKGPHDDQLVWPLRRNFEIKLLNQIGDKLHHSKRIIFDGDNYKSSAGSESDVVGDRGRFKECTKFITHNDICKVTPKCRYISDYEDNSIYFQVKQVADDTICECIGQYTFYFICFLMFLAITSAINEDRH